MPPYRLVIFDFDGTLADSLPWFRSVFDEMVERFGLAKITADELEAMRGLPAREVMKRMQVPAWKLPKIVSHMRAAKLAAASSTPLFEGAAELLAALKVSGVKTAIVSSDTEASVRAVLGEGLAAEVGHFDCGAAVFGKAAKFRRAVKLAGVGLSETLSVGDEVRDIEAARAAGIAAAAVGWGYTFPQALESAGPDMSFEALADLSAFLLGG
ncbi:MAG TPA: HAD hydrolase-like protein [Caulobacteraceae bacterium]|nr:HAD hydrolase-like protein [Caulobacteraceae bacterium]